MSLQKQSAKHGAWLFRRRSYLPLLLAAIILPAFHGYAYLLNTHFYDLIWEFSCFAVSIFGLLIRCCTIGHTPEGTSGRNTRNQVAQALNTSGMYATTRNPLYLGNFFMMLGVTMFVRLWWISVIYALAFWLYYERIIMAEEAFLKGKFGKQYENYLERTPAFIPNFKLWRPPALSFSSRTVLKREYPGFFGVVAAFTFLEVVGDYFLEKTLVIDPIWAGIFIFGLLTYVTLRTLKKKTRILHVKGR